MQTFLNISVLQCVLLAPRVHRIIYYQELENYSLYETFTESNVAEIFLLL